MVEMIQIVDENDRIIGVREKEKCHTSKGILHRAFTVIVKNSKNQFLITQRSGTKKLWPGFWDGSISSHVHEEETTTAAVIRRLKEELKIECKNVKCLFKIRYKFPYKYIGIENEFDYFFIAESNDTIEPDPTEISDFNFLKLKKLKKDIERNSSKYVPWFFMIVKRWWKNE